MTTCACSFPQVSTVAETRLLKTEEGEWHCIRCGWPVPADHWRVKREIWARDMAAKSGIGPDAPMLSQESRQAELERLHRICQRSRRISISGLIMSVCLITMALAQVFGLVSRPPPMIFSFFLGFFFALAVYLGVIAYRQARALSRR